MKYKFYPKYEDQWVSSGGTHVRGSAFLDGERYNKSDLINLFSSFSSKPEFTEILEDLNGYFAVIHPIGDELLVATDHIRSIPLFYTDVEGNLVVGTDSQRIVDHAGCYEYDPIREAEYIVIGYVTGRDTLCDGIYQVQAGEIVALVDDATNPAARDRYYRYQHDNVTKASESELLEKMDDVLVSAFNRLIDYADGRTIVVSMSGGYDSRLLIAMLVRLGYDDVIAVTYDHTGDEAEYCRSVAAKLGVQWEYIRQSHEEWRDWYHSKDREKHDQSAGIIDAVPTNGPAIAIKKLKEENRIPDDSVLITGDAATATGEHIPASLMSASEGGRKSFVDAILSYHYEFWEYDKTLEQKFRDRIQTATEIDQFDTPNEVIDAFELWDWQERQPKHILRNDLFEFWGYDWWYPLWDLEVMGFLRTVPVDHRYDRNLYEKYIKILYANVADLSREEAKESFHERSSLVTNVEQLLTGTPLKEPAEQLYRKYIAPRKYQDNPIWGIMQREQFETVQSGRQVIHAFRVLDILGRMSFEPRWDGEIPKSGIVTYSQMNHSRESSSTNAFNHRDDA